MILREPLFFGGDLMIHQLGSSSSIITACKDAAGIAGNVFAIGLFVSPVPTFRRIVRNQSTEQFSGLPYIYALLNCLITMWYGTPLVSSNNTMVVSVNLAGSLFQLVYIALYISYADKDRKVRIAGLLVADLCIFGIIVGGSLQIGDLSVRRIVVGVLSCVALISMFASPLFIINLVIRTKSVEFMPFYLSLSTFLMSASFFIYGLLNQDLFIFVMLLRASVIASTVLLTITPWFISADECLISRFCSSFSGGLQIPNGLGSVLGLTQLVLYFHFKQKGREALKEPLIESYDRTVQP